MRNDDWYATIRVRLPHMLEHDHPDGEAIVRDLLKEESLINFSDLNYPDDYEILSIEPATPKAAP